MAKKQTTFSIVIPVFNEEGNIENLVTEIKSVLKHNKMSSEIIVVDDGSTDKTRTILKGIRGIKTIYFRKNFGQSAALDAGIKHSTGKYIVTLDGDGQNDPNDIPKMFEELQKSDLDVICGWRKKRKDSFSKRYISLGARFLRSFLVNDGIHDSGCTLRIYKSECFEDINLYGELHRMIPALLIWRGYKISEIEVEHHSRKYGRSKYSWNRTIKGFLDMLNIWFWRKYSSRPIHLFGSVGIVLINSSFFSLLYLGYLRLFHSYGLSDKIWPLIAIGGLVVGIQLIIFGLLADLIIRATDQKHYYIKEISK